MHTLAHTFYCGPMQWHTLNIQTAIYDICLHQYLLLVFIIHTILIWYHSQNDAHTWRETIGCDMILVRHIRGGGGV